MLGVEGDDKDDPILKSLSDRFDRLQALRARLVGGRTTAFVLVLIPERLPIEETARALVQLDDTGVRVGGLVVNRVLPAATTDAFLQARREQERIYLDEIARRFGDRPRVELPQFPKDVYGLASLAPIADALLAATGVPDDHQPSRMSGDYALPFQAYVDDAAAQGDDALAILEKQESLLASMASWPEPRPAIATPTASGPCAKWSATWPTPSASSPIACCASREATRRRCRGSTRTPTSSRRLRAAHAGQRRRRAARGAECDAAAREVA